MVGEMAGKSVQKQVQDRRAQIMDLARSFADHPERFEWLRFLLAAHGLDSGKGILLELRSVPDQGCWVHYGMWLTGSERFLRFVADEAFGVRELDSSGCLETSQVEDVTEQTSTEQFVRGTGRSFGFLALEALRELGKS